MRIFILFIAIFPIFISPCQTNNDQVLSFKLDSIITIEFPEDQPGGSLLVRKNNKTLYSRSFGLADIGTHEKFTARTISNTGSISKTFVAYGILILQNKGLLSIEDPIIKYFPDFRNKEIASKVRIKHLLTHSSGLPDSRGVDKDSIFYLTANDEQNFAPLKGTEKLEFEPGSQWKYSNPSFNGLALIIEKVSGLKWQSFIDKNIFRPSGMINSKITDGAFPTNGVAHAYINVNNRWKEFDYGEYPTFTAAGNGGVWSSVEELDKYVKAINDCLFLDCKTIALSQQVWVPANWEPVRQPSQGFSWFVLDQKATDEYKVISHSGSQAGFCADLMMIPEPGITIIWLTNNNRFITPMIYGVMEKLGYVK